MMWPWKATQPPEAEALAETLSTIVRLQTETCALAKRISEVISDHAAHMLAVETVLGIALRELHADPAALRRIAHRELDGEVCSAARAAVDGIVARLASGRPS